jgi:hypothetical protein
MAIARTTIVDDDGTLTTGTIWNNAWKVELYDQIDAEILAASGRGVVQTTTSTGTQNNFSLTANCAVLRCNNASELTITGMSAGQDGQRLIVVSIGAGHVKFSHQAAGSTAANRLINTATSGPTPIAAGKGAATYVYDATTARWRLAQHFQGAPIAVPYTSTDFTADAGTWTVDSGDLNTFNYYLTGNAMQVTVVITFSTTSGVNIGLLILIPNGYTISSVVNDIASVTPVGVGAAGIAQINNSVSTTKIRVLKIDFSAWANGTNNNGVSFTLNFPVD